MKRNKVFELSIILNCISYLAITARTIYTSLHYRIHTGFDYVIGFLVIVFILIVLPFNYYCYKLHKAYHHNHQLSKRANIIGVILVVLYSLFSFLLLYGIYDMLKDFFAHSVSGDLQTRLMYLVYFLFTGTTVYLSIAYWSVKRQVETQMSEVVTELGKDVKS